MATNRTVTVKSSGGDYTSLVAALANEAHNLTNVVSGGRQLTIQCFPISGGDARVSAAQFGDASKPWTTNSTCFLQIEGSADIGPTLDTSKYYLKATDQNVLELGNINNLVLADLQFQLTGTTASGTGTRSCIRTGVHTGSTNTITIRRCVSRLIRSSGSTALVGLDMSAPGGVNWVLRNLLFFASTFGHFDYGSYWSANPALLAMVDNCSFVNASHLADQAVACGNVRFRNCGLSGGGDWPGTWSSASDHNAMQSGTPPGTNPRSSVTPSFLNAGANDYHLASGDTAWKGQAANLSTEFTNDIENLVRTAPWDIGASEFVATISSFSGTGQWLRSAGHDWTGIGQHTAAGGGSRGGMLTLLSEE